MPADFCRGPIIQFRLPQNKYTNYPCPALNQRRYTHVTLVFNSNTTYLVQTNSIVSQSCTNPLQSDLTYIHKSAHKLFQRQIFRSLVIILTIQNQPPTPLPTNCAHKSLIVVMDLSHLFNHRSTRSPLACHFTTLSPSAIPIVSDRNLALWPTTGTAICEYVTPTITRCNYLAN